MIISPLFTPKREVFITLSANAQNYNLATVLSASYKGAGVIWPADIYVTINGGVIIGSVSTGTAAWQTGNLYNASGTGRDTFVQLTVNGLIRAAGGNGGGGSFGNANPGGAGSAGGHAISLGHDLTVVNNGTVAGGGGGGGGGAGNINPSGSGGGGGGGAGDTNPGNAGPSGNVSFAFAGQSGTVTTGGAGGTAFGGFPTPGFIGGDGGAGGALGVAGTIGGVSDFGSSALPGAGGAAGFYQVQNGWTLTWTVTGTRLGSAS